MVKFKVNTKSFIKCIDFVSVSAPTIDGRKQLNSIQVTFDNVHNALVLVATNGHHLSTVKLSLDEKEGNFEGFEFLIPTECVKQIKTIFGKDKCSISVQVVDGQMTIEGVDKTSMVVNNLETGLRYPDTSRFTKPVQDESLPYRSYATLNPKYVSVLSKAFDSISENKFPSVEITFPKVSGDIVLFTTKTALTLGVFEPLSVLMPVRN